MSGLVSFAFKAVRRDGTLETGVLTAATRAAAVSLIGSRGAFPVEITAESSSGPRVARIDADDLALGLRALATVLEAGIPLARALHLMDDLVPPAWREALPDLRRRVAQGEQLAAGLAASRLPFPPHAIGIIQAGEAGGGLAAAVASAARLLEGRAATRAALRNALAYPVMLAVAGTASLALLVGIVLPRFATLLTETGQALPVMTRFVLGLGAVARVALVPSILLAAMVGVVWRAWVARPEGLARWHQLLLAVPGIGPIRCSAAAANACSALAAMLGAGVPLAVALPHAALASGDRALGDRLLAARGRIGRGATIASALEAENALTPTVARLVRVGEETGRLAEMLAHAARVEASHAQQRLHRLVRVLEPAFILVFGGLVMIVAAGLLQAMYGLRPVS